MKHFTKCRSVNSVPRVVNIVRKEDDPIVQNDLAITPAQMLELTHQGFAISAQNARILREAAAAPAGEVPPEYRRGFDMADGYQMMREVHCKARKAVDGLRNGDILPLQTKVKPSKDV